MWETVSFGGNSQGGIDFYGGYGTKQEHDCCIYQCDNLYTYGTKTITKTDFEST